MPFGGMLSLGLGAVSAGSGLAGLFGGGNKVPQGYQFGGMGTADTGAINLTGGLGQYNVPAQLLPQYQDITQNMVNNPYAGGYQQGAGTAGAMGMGSGMNAYQAGGDLTSSAMGMMPDVSALLSMGFDPQNALYSRTQQQLQDQTRASQEARGIGMSPYGAGLENQAMSNFNIDWQNNQLGRAAQGAGAAGGLYGQIAQGVNTGQGMQSTAGAQFLQGAGTPYGTFQGINADALGALGQAGQFGQSAANIPQMQIQDYLGYLGKGTAATQTAMQGQGQQFNQNQTLGGNIGGGIAQMARGWGNMGSTPWNSGQMGSSMGNAFGNLAFG